MSEKVVTSLICVLQEFAVRNNQRRPSYKFITRKEDACIKVCSVTYFNETITGIGSSKKKAKRAAARNMIRHLCTKSDPVRLELLPIVQLVDKTTNAHKNPLHKNNFVGQLFDYCRSNILPTPTYEIQELDPFKFQAECTVDNVQELVIGPTKKRAKQRAAKMALEAIQLRQSKWYDNAKLGDYTSDLLPDWWQISVKDLLSYCSKIQLPEPSFRDVAMKLTTAKGVKCTINDVEKLGTGLTERGAKLAAARLMYQTIRLAQTTGNVDSLFGTKAPKEELKLKPTKTSVDNYIGQLYEYCVKTELPTPSFRVTGHNWNIYRFSKYRVRCTVGSIKFVAAGRRMKLAKHAAAKMMLDKVRTIDKNETREIADDADASLHDDDMDSDNSEQSTQPDDLQVEENETKEITEESVVSLRIDGIGSNHSEPSTQPDDLQVEENEAKEITEESVVPARIDGIGSNHNEPSTQPDDLQVEENETKEITEGFVVPARIDSIGSNHSEPSTQPDDLQVKENETKEIAEEAVVSLRINGIGSNYSEQSTQVEENETKEIAEEAVLISRDDGIGSNDSEQSTQNDDIQADEIDTVELTKETVLISRDIGIASIDNEQSVRHNDIQIGKIETLIIRFDSTDTSTDTDDDEQSTRNNDSRFI